MKYSLLVGKTVEEVLQAMLTEEMPTQVIRKVK